jgi:hypothetical protein
MYPRLPSIKHGPITPQQARITGVVLVVAGLFLLALGLALLAYILDFFTLGDILPGVYRDPEASEEEISIGALFFIGFILLFGLVSLIEGFWRILYRQSNKHLLAIMLVLGGIFIAAGIFARAIR